MKVLEGDLVEEQYPFSDNHIPPEELVVQKTSELNVNDSAYISDDIGLHRVYNKCSETPAVSLHIYSPPYDACQCFNQKGERKTCTITWYSVDGERTEYDYGRCDDATALSTKVEQEKLSSCSETENQDDLNTNT
eukprot:TRINITY_DN824_c1_g1_i4.p1 TRINITY_DN824_c1_g1~~TRINITY_DN824_c1_g1_i4.p1  ORF type:complete len:135 (+),score=18.83 TRINITY_DN824_c1_g1_i4:513-917(+)